MSHRVQPPLIHLGTLICIGKASYDPLILLQAIRQHNAAVAAAKAATNQVCHSSFTPMCLLPAHFQVTEELRAYDAVMNGTNNTATDAIVYRTCETAPLAEALQKPAWDIISEIANQVVECATLGEEMCNSKPHCAIFQHPNATQAICFLDIQVIIQGARAPFIRSLQALVDANPTPYSMRFANITNQCINIKSATECQSAAMPAGVGGVNAPSNGGDNTLVVASEPLEAPAPALPGALGGP